jgi:hypothetical protein
MNPHTYARKVRARKARYAHETPMGRRRQAAREAALIRALTRDAIERLQAAVRQD